MRATTATLSQHSAPYVQHSAGEFVDLNPPLTHALLIPLRGLSDDDAAWTWRSIDALCFGCAVCLIASAGWSTRRAGFVAAAVVASPATVLELAAGQIAGVLSLGLAVAWRHRQRARGGLLLGIVVAAKPFLAPVLLWAWWRGERRLALFGVLGALSSASLGVALYGVSATAAWIGALRSVVWTASEFNASLFRFGPAVALIGAVAIAGVALLGRSEEWFALAIVGCLLLSPLGWIYYLWLPAPWLIRRALKERWPLWTAPLWVPIHFALMPPTWLPLLRWSYPVGLVALFTWLAITQSRSLRTPAPQTGAACVP